MKNKSEKRYGNLDIIKGICIIFVIITHYKWTDEQRLKYFFPFWIGMAIPVFLYISGYLNAISFKKKQIDSLEKAYNKQIIINKVIRFTIPFLIVFSLQGGCLVSD